METFITKEGKYVAVDGDKAIVFDVKAVEKEMAFINAELMIIPQTPSDEQLLAWARVNYPMMDYSVKVASLEDRKRYLQTLLNGVK